jgi:arginine utilization regulatory protein
LVAMLQPAMFSREVGIILDTIEEGIHVVNEDGITVLYNRRAAELDNLIREEVLGKHLLDVFPSLSPVSSTLLQVLATGKPVADHQQTFQNFKGDQITTINSTRPIYHHGALIGAVEVSRDITLLRDMAEKLVDLQAELYAKKTVRSRKVPGKARYTFDDIIGRSAAMQPVFELARKAAETSSAVLIHGETGTGKELFAHAIHNASSRGAGVGVGLTGPFIAQNCAAMPDTLLEAILFGTVKGSFTGADDRPGLFEVADKGTLFLDEIDSMPLDLQPKLLRVLQDGMVRRVGAATEKAVDVRLITACRMNPRTAVEKGLLREDLFYRINVISIAIPPLRERMEDIPDLVSAFINKYNARLGRAVTRATESALNSLRLYSWPGNVRELEHFVEATMTMLDRDDTVIDPGDWRWNDRLPSGLGNMSSIGAGSDASANAGKSAGKSVGAGAGASNDAYADASLVVGSEGGEAALRTTLNEMEENLIRRTMAECRGNVSEAARRLGIPRQTLQYKLKKLLRS